jgi:hypothetical protein
VAKDAAEAKQLAPITLHGDPDFVHPIKMCVEPAKGEEPKPRIRLVKS